VSSVQPVLVFGYGNPGRGDDALGPEVVAAIEIENQSNAGHPLVETQTDMQLQVEHVTDLEGRERILFVDADMSCEAPYTFNTLEPEKDGSYTSHAMTPGALLHAYKKVYGADAPPAYMLRIRGYDFELGNPMGEQATANLASAIELVKKLCTNRSEEHWAQHFTNTGSHSTQDPSCRLPGCGGYTLPTNIERSD
jgi:hydrogenase maturation protease